jgi:hypothetical protein
MGQIKTILFTGKVSLSENNTLFRITRNFGCVIIEYRNIRIRLKNFCFLNCLKQFQALARETVERFPYRTDKHLEPVCFQKLSPNMASSNKVEWRDDADGRFVVKYRYLEADFSQQEGNLFRSSVSPAVVKKKKLRHALRDFIKKLMGRRTLEEPLLYGRLSIDLCENIHIHFQNLRFEFDLNEFLFLWDALAAVGMKTLRSGRGELICRRDLPESTEWNNRFQVEEQAEGHFHLHYRNLRIEFRDFSEVGLLWKFGAIYGVDSDYENRWIGSNWRLEGIRTETISNLKAIVYTPEGERLSPIKDTPIYRSLVQNSPEIYYRYKDVILRFHPDNSNKWETFQELRRSIEQSGFEDNKLIIIKGPERRIMDGQHRVAILTYLFGEQFKVKVAHYK